jgi:hypothetical protein
MALLRALAWIFLLAAVIALVNDLTRANATGLFVQTSLMAYWKTLAPQSLAAFAGFVQRVLSPRLWDPVLVRVLVLPAWMALCAAGLLCALLGRRKRRVNIFAN